MIKANMAKAENDSVLAALALIVEHVEQLHQYVVLCLNCEPANDSMIGGYDAEDYNEVVCQTREMQNAKVTQIPLPVFSSLFLGNRPFRKHGRFFG